MGFPVEDLRTNESEVQWEKWRNNSCQPNHRQVSVSFQNPLALLSARIYLGVLRVAVESYFLSARTFYTFLPLQNVVPDPKTSCGPYSPADGPSTDRTRMTALSEEADASAHAHAVLSDDDDDIDPDDHREGHSDTTGLIIVDGNGKVAVGVTTNGLGRKVPG